MSNKKDKEQEEEWIKRLRTYDSITNSDKTPHANI
jgi:hypothetical protein|nr:MAG TPA: hypothetical protein [Caudoviricetes sp.]